MRKISFNGRLGKDPETKTSSKGYQYMNFSVGNNEWAASNKQSETYWFNVNVFDSNLFNFVSKLKKGAHVYVYGDYNDRISVNQTTQQPVIIREVVLKDIQFLSTKNSDESGNTGNVNKATINMQVPQTPIQHAPSTYPKGVELNEEQNVVNNEQPNVIIDTPVQVGVNNNTSFDDELPF